MCPNFKRHNANLICPQGFDDADIGNAVAGLMTAKFRASAQTAYLSFEYMSSLASTASSSLPSQQN